MDWQRSKKPLIFTTFFILAFAIDGTLAVTTVTGSVFCDQCKDGQISLFDYPLPGMKVAMTCVDSNGQTTMSREETTNWLGGYSLKFDGAPDLTRCYAQVTGGGQGSHQCTAALGPAQKPRLVFNFFNMAMYTVDSLLSQPAQPMSFCPRSGFPVPPPVTPVTPPPAFRLPPMPKLPPMPHLPPVPSLPPTPPVPFLEASACSHQSWMMPQYRCYWRAVNPEMKVSVVFGMLAARRYGKDMNLWQGLQGRGDPYRTLLREGTTALLNSYNSLQFPYPTLSVIHHMNMALMGSNRNLLITAFRFMKANSGAGGITCKFTPCK